MGPIEVLAGQPGGQDVLGRASVQSGKRRDFTVWNAVFVPSREALGQQFWEFWDGRRGVGRDVMRTHWGLPVVHSAW